MNVYLSNLQPDPIDPRDYIFEVERDVILPESVNLREFTGQVENQLNTGSCTANATVSACEMYLASAGLFQDTPATDALDRSRRFNYYTSRELLGPQFLTGDPGSTERMALRAGNKLGIPAELICTYDESRMNEKPSDEAYADAANFKIGEYRRIKYADIDDCIFQIRYALAKGWPVALGLRIGHKLRDLPPDELYGFTNSLNPYWGNHEMLIFGYGKTDKNLPYFEVENSWGPDWCDNGCFKMLATVVAVDAIDVWVMQGFAGVERVGVDQVKPKPVPVPPAPDPIPAPPVLDPVPVPPMPEPEPVPPQPEPPAPPAPEPPAPTPDPVPPAPTPEPAPVEKEDSDKLPLIIGALAIIAFIIAHASGLFK